MTAPVVESSSVASGAATGTVTITKPSGTASGDLLVAFTFAVNFGSGQVTPPSGFTSPQDDTSVSGDFCGAAWVKAAGGSEPASYDFGSPEGEDLTVIMVRISGHDGVEASTELDAAYSSGNLVFPSVTSITNDALILLCAGIANSAAPGGSTWPNVGPADTTVANKEVSVAAGWGIVGGIAYFTQATAGATGTKSVTGSSSGDNYYAVSIAVKPAAGGGATEYTADLTAGSFSVTGSSLTVPTARNAALTAGSFTVTGSDLTVPTARNAALSAGSFAVTGSNLTVPTARNADLTAGSFAVTGSSLSVPTGRNADLTAGSFAVTGSNLSVPIARSADLTAGAFAVTGSDVDGVYVDNGAPVAYEADLSPGVFSITGSSIEATATGQEQVSYGDLSHSPTFSKSLDKRRKKQRKEDDELKRLLKRLLGEVPEDAPEEIEEAAQVAQATVERVTVPEISIDVGGQLKALQTARLQLAKLEAMIRAYEESEDEDDLLLAAA